MIQGVSKARNLTIIFFGDPKTYWNWKLKKKWNLIENLCFYIFFGVHFSAFYVQFGKIYLLYSSISVMNSLSKFIWSFFLGCSSWKNLFVVLFLLCTSRYNFAKFICSFISKLYNLAVFIWSFISLGFTIWQNLFVVLFLRCAIWQNLFVVLFLRCTIWQNLFAQ